MGDVQRDVIVSQQCNEETGKRRLWFTGGGDGKHA